MNNWLMPSVYVVNDNSFDLIFCWVNVLELSLVWLG